MVTAIKHRARRRLRDAALRAAQVMPPSPDAHELIAPVCEGRILPPYPGEMGVEIRFFLARVEPWLRGGWKILSRRPELYPEGSAILDAALTQAEDALFAKYDAVRLASGPCIIRPGEGRLRTWRALVARAKSQQLQEEWRRLLRPYLAATPGRPWTRWDTDLMTVSSAFAIHQMWLIGDAQPPGYLPPAFVSDGPENVYPAHVGVQFRALGWNPDDRNSDVAAVLEEAQRVAAHLSLPLLIYGDRAGCHLPDGAQTTASIGEGRLLSRELGYLRTCEVMMAPNSGWADLMCWLRVPVIVERRGATWIFDMLAPFQPRFMLRDPGVPVEQQVDRLLDGDSDLPHLGHGHVDVGSLDSWLAGKSARPSPRRSS